MQYSRKSLIRNVRVSSGLLISNILSKLVTPAAAIPIVPALSSNATLTSASSSAAESSAPSQDDRGGSFQILADGTQDLAALVGVFATDSVERYAIDYNKGYLSSAAATLSLLGLLGYVRALIKLGLGQDSCHNAGFDTKALRPLFGIPDVDRLPSDVVHNVNYFERARKEGYIEWKSVATTKHTVDSMQLLTAALPLPDSEPDRISIISCNLQYPDEIIRSHKGSWRVPLFFTACVGATCFVIIPFGNQSHRLSWTVYFATFGLFFSILLSSLAWAWVFAQEQLPSKPTHWIHYEHSLGYRYGSWSLKSLQKQDHFAFIRSGNSYATFNIKKVGGKIRMAICVFSLAAGMSAIVGYVCQYIELRRTTPAESGIWLAVQGSLALLRLAIWIIDPQFDHLKFERAQFQQDQNRLNLSETQLVMLWETHIAPARTVTYTSPEFESEGVALIPWAWDEWQVPDSLKIPVWALEALDMTNKRLQSGTWLAETLRGHGNDWDKALSKLQSAQYYWDLPGWLFMCWVNAHCRSDLFAKGRPQVSYSCRVIKDEDGDFHFLPYWTARSQEILAIDPLDPVDHSGGVLKKCLGNLPVQIFGDPRSEDRCVISFAEEDPADLASKQTAEYVVGWRTLIPLGLLKGLNSKKDWTSPDWYDPSTETKEPIAVRLIDSFTEPLDERSFRDPNPGVLPTISTVAEAMDSMWADLESILQRVK